MSEIICQDWPNLAGLGVQGAVNYALEFRWLWGTPDGKWRWYRRVMQRIGLVH
jgi:hypothetical protein